MMRIVNPRGSGSLDYVVRNPSRISSNWRAQRSLDEELRDFGVVGISGVDTRALTRHLREAGAMRVGIFSGAASRRSPDDLLEAVRASPGMVGANLTEEVTTDQVYTIAAIGEPIATVVAVDLGIKSMTPHRMAERGITVHVVPATIGWEGIVAFNPDGVFFSNGPGDPAAADHAVALMTSALEAKIPVFGICFGNQILGRALGLPTYKLRFGHRGINQPVQDLTTGKVEVTAHNHGFAVQAPVGEVFETPFGGARVSHVCLNDGVVEGLELVDGSAFSVQYHPEAAAGPHDASYLFDRFASALSPVGGR